MVPIRQGDDCGKTVLVLARSATPNREMERLCTEVASLPGVKRAGFAFWEEGAPSLRQALCELVHDETGPILIIPLTMPTDRAFETWLPRVLHRWQAQDARPWPEIRVAPLIADHPTMAGLLGAALAFGGNALDLSEKKKIQQGSRVLPQKRCLLVCHGGSCNSAGAALIWGRLRNEEARQLLQAAGEGTTAAKSSCLGPCALAPIVQVWPEGTYYGGVDEAATDRIIRGHLLGGKVVEDIAYHPVDGKQTLRTLRTVAAEV